MLGVVCLAWLVLSPECCHYTEVEQFTTKLDQRHLFGEKSTRDVVVIIERNSSGKERAFILDATSKTWVNVEWVREILLKY